MQDRIPLYPGRVKLIPVNGQTNTYDMVRADEPTEAGTPLNKASLLKDTTASLYGLGADAVPDDVLVKLGSIRPKVGDIKYTARTDLDETWLLCNGETISASEYPELAAILAQGGPAGTWATVSSPISGSDGLGKAAFGNGTFFVSAYGFGDDFSIAYADSPSQTWTKSQMATSGRCNGVAFANNLYFALGMDGNSAPILYYSNSPSGPWASKTMPVTRGGLYDITYGSGYYVACGSQYSTARHAFYYTTSPDGTWTANSAYNANGEFKACAYGGGNFVFGGEESSGSETRIFYTSAPNGNVTPVTLYSSYESVNDIVYYNGRFMACTATCLYYATDPTGSWTRVPLGITGGNAIACSGEIITVVGSSQIAYSRSVDGPWTTNSAGVSRNSGIAAGNASYVVTSGGSTLYYIQNNAIPTITSDKSFAYIKALED